MHKKKKEPDSHRLPVQGSNSMQMHTEAKEKQIPRDSKYKDSNSARMYKEAIENEMPTDSKYRDSKCMQIFKETQENKILTGSRYKDPNCMQTFTKKQTERRSKQTADKRIPFAIEKQIPTDSKYNDSMQMCEEA